MDLQLKRLGIFCLNCRKYREEHLGTWHGQWFQLCGTGYMCLSCCHRIQRQRRLNQYQCDPRGQSSWLPQQWFQECGFHLWVKALRNHPRHQRWQRTYQTSFWGEKRVSDILQYQDEGIQKKSLHQLGESWTPGIQVDFQHEHHR